MPGSITLQPNVPIQLALESTEGELDARYPKVHYTTTDGRTLTVSTQTAAKLNLLELRSGEAFCIVKRSKPEGVEYDVWLAGDSEQRRAYQEQVTADPFSPVPVPGLTPSDCIAPAWLVDAQRRAWQPGDGECPFCKRPDCEHWTGNGWTNPKTPPALIERSRKVISENEKLRKLPRRAPAVEQPRLFDRGTGTDGPLPKRQPVIAPPPPKRIPYNVAFVEVCAFVTAGLKEAGEQWNDQAKQDMVSTILISAAKAHLLTLWERGE